jgi:hypothetical protein
VVGGCETHPPWAGPKTASLESERWELIQFEYPWSRNSSSLDTSPAVGRTSREGGNGSWVRLEGAGLKGLDGLRSSHLLLRIEVLRMVPWVPLLLPFMLFLPIIIHGTAEAASHGSLQNKAGA